MATYAPCVPGLLRRGVWVENWACLSLPESSCILGDTAAQRPTSSFSFSDNRCSEGKWRVWLRLAPEGHVLGELCMWHRLEHASGVETLVGNRVHSLVMFAATEMPGAGRWPPCEGCKHGHRTVSWSECNLVDQLSFRKSSASIRSWH